MDNIQAWMEKNAAYYSKYFSHPVFEITRAAAKHFDENEGARRNLQEKAVEIFKNKNLDMGEDREEQEDNGR